MEMYGKYCSVLYHNRWLRDMSRKYHIRDGFEISKSLRSDEPC